MQEAGVAAGTGRPCVLVVDDDQRSLNLMTIVLGKAGYRVLTARGAAAGLEVFSMERPDAVLVDLLMPDIDGLEFCRRVRGSTGRPGPTLVLFTAMASTEVRRQAQAIGADDVFLKPFDRSALLERLADLLQRSGARYGGDANTD